MNPFLCEETAANDFSTKGLRRRVFGTAFGVIGMTSTKLPLWLRFFLLIERRPPRDTDES
jgi:hypothetical protein